MSCNPIIDNDRKSLATLSHAETTPVQTASITGLWWGEVDSPEDLAVVRTHFDEEELKRAPHAWAAPGR